MRTVFSVMLFITVSAATVVAQPVELAVTTPNRTDVLFTGYPGTIVFTMNSNTIEVAGVVWPLQYTFSNGNILGPLLEPTEISFSPKAQSDFETNGWNVPDGSTPTDPDTSLTVCVDFDQTGWQGAGAVWQIDFVPLDTGSITMDSMALTLGPLMDVVAMDASSLPFTWGATTITVAECPIPVTGDATWDGRVDASDVIRVVCLAFICDFPTECDYAVADVDCSGTITAVDIIYLVNFVFRSGPAPCDVCPLILDGTWDCQP